MEKRIYIVLLTGLMLLSCSPRALHEAKRVVVEADSLRAEGRMYDDSLALAQAYGTLGQWSWFHADEYAHACYHYGRLLREKDNPAAAMECFISATHAPTRDYYILGRVYSNIGDICHKGRDYQLSYDMFEYSANHYKNHADYLNYYYALYKMAFEKAVLGEKDRVYEILNFIESANMADSLLTSCCLITKAKKCMCCQEYDSAVNYAYHALRYNPREHTARILLAQAFSYLGEKDSAVCYAKQVLDSSNDLGNLNNALYILTNDDMTKDLEFVRQTAAERADIQKLVEIRQGKLSQAVQLLEQDLQRKPDWRGYALAFVIVISVVALVVSVRVWKKRKQQMNKQVSSLADQQADTIIESIKKHIDVSNLEDTLHWKDYSAMKSEADLYMGGIVSKLEAYHLNEVEIRFCVLTVLNFSQKQIADTIHYSYPSGIKTLKKRTADKLSTTPPKLRDFLLHMLPKT